MMNAINEVRSATFDYSQRWRSSAEVSMRMRARARWLQEQAVASNLDNAAAYARTRDGWTQSIDQFLGRMGELAVMANDGTKSTVDRQALQAEFSQMQQAIQSITTGPNAMGRFNGIPLFQGGALSYGDPSATSRLLTIA